MKKSEFSDSGVKVDYVEEVDENELYDKKNQTDIIYSQSILSKSKNVILIIFIVVLFFVSLFSLIFGFTYFNKTVDNGEVYTLFVTHSNSHYGGEKITFDNYNSLETSYEYDFSVNNSNDVNLSYRIQIENVNFGVDNINYNNINYSLLNHSKKISSGTFNNDKVFEIVSTDIAANSNEKFVLKIWSNNVDEKLEYSFKVNILV